jgi:hypothetical protein
VFGYDVPAIFSCKGTAELHVSGYYQPGPPDSDDENMDMDGMDGMEGMDGMGGMYDGEDDDDDEMSPETQVRNPLVYRGFN